MADRLMRADLAADDAPPKIDTTVAHIARVYDYWLGGKDHFAVDRAVGEKVLEIHPETVLSVRANRAFLARSVRYLAATEGVRQFLDIGTGLPSANNTHEVAQAAAPSARIVYVDNDPIVLAHARALLTSSQEGATAYLDADIRDTDTILAGAAEVLDFREPVAVMLVVPLGIIGTISATMLRGLANDVFFQVGLLTTVGLSAKNAILIVEFAKENLERGMDLVDATLSAARQRLRPILMTSMAFVLGVMPLAIATGAGAGGRVAIGTGVIGGMLTATVLAVFLVPVFFIGVRSIFHGRSTPAAPAPAAQPKAGA